MPSETWKPPPDLRGCGLWASVSRGGRIDVAAWRRAEADGAIVGTCRACGGYLAPDPLPERFADDAVTWYIARCLGCGHEVASPGGRLRSRRHGGA